MGVQYMHILRISKTNLLAHQHNYTNIPLLLQYVLNEDITVHGSYCSTMSKMQEIQFSI